MHKTMSNQCKNCDMRDTNNNFLSTNLNLISSNHNNNRNNGQNTGSMTNSNITCTAKVMWGTVGAISELREKEQADKKRMANNMSGSGGNNNRKDQK